MTHGASSPVLRFLGWPVVRAAEAGGARRLRGFYRAAHEGARPVLRVLCWLERLLVVGLRMTYRERVLEQVKTAVLAALAGRDARVYLFGSLALGSARRTSDIDVAVEPRRALPPELLAHIRESLEESTIPYEVDLVDLSEAEPAFAERVRREGVLWKD